MADIRINALATTAASTASDDFVAVDGSANGTRKLNAFSPTFGGNLTVNGTGLFNGDVTLSKVGPKFLLTDTSDTSWSVRSSGGYYLFKNETANIDIARFIGSTLATAKLEILATTDSSSKDTGAIVTEGGLGVEKSASIGGNLTVSGTGNSTFSGPVRLLDATNPNSANGGFLWGQAGVGPTLSGLNVAFNTGATSSQAERGRFHSSGSFLLGTTTDSSNGRIQLATHTTIAGGIGLGTATSIWTVGSGSIRFGDSTNTAQIAISGSGVYIGASAGASGNTILTSGSGTTALTLASDQSAQFQNTVTLYTVGASSTGQNSLIFTGADGNGNVRTPAKIIGKHAGNGGYGNLVFQTAFNNSLVDALSIDSSQRCILAGALRLNNAYVAGAPTATGYVTLQDSAGNTYKVLVGT